MYNINDMFVSMYLFFFHIIILFVCICFYYVFWCVINTHRKVKRKLKCLTNNDKKFIV